jgi:hypothetical protein
MSSTTPNLPTITNPLQANNSALMIVGYVAGVLAAKLPIFDFATWNYIILSVGGVIFTGVSVFLNRKSAVISTTGAIAAGPRGMDAVAAQTALIEATSAVALDPTIPKSTEAKAALIDAVSAQPEVVGKIGVTDQAVVDATTSKQVQKVPS